MIRKTYFGHVDRHGLRGRRALGRPARRRRPSCKVDEGRGRRRRRREAVAARDARAAPAAASTRSHLAGATCDATISPGAAAVGTQGKHEEPTDGPGLQLAARTRDGVPVRGCRAREAVHDDHGHEQVHRLPELHDRVQVDVDVGRGPGVHALEQHRDEARSASTRPAGTSTSSSCSARRSGTTTSTAARRSSRRRPEGERVLGWAPDEVDWNHPNLGEDEPDRRRRRDVRYVPDTPHSMMWMYYLQRICNHCTYPACVAACPREAIYKRPGGRDRPRRPDALPRLPGVPDRLPVQEDDVQPRDARLREVHRLLPEDRAGPPDAVHDGLHRAAAPDELPLAARQGRSRASRPTSSST